MRPSTVLIALVAPFFVSAAPHSYGKRTAADILVLTFADVLEQLEFEFYSQAISKFKESDFTTGGFSSSTIPVEQFTNIVSDEKTHSSVLQVTLKSIGGTPITSCKFDFSSVLVDVATMLATARVVENVGVGAYLGGATLLTDSVLLDAAGSILTVEARHQTILNIFSGGSAIPSAFDIPLAPNEVLAIASPFISGCDVGIKANPTLTITNKETVKPGTKLSFQSAAINGSVSTNKLFCQMMVGGAPFSIALPFDSCVVPDGINGPVAIFVTSDGQPLSNNLRDRAKDKLIAGPTMAYIDTKSEALGQVARSGSSSSSSSGGGTLTTITTSTLSPEQASSVVAGAAPSQSTSASSSSGSATVATDSAAPTNSSSDSAANSTTSGASATNTSAGTASTSASAATPQATGSTNLASGGPNMATGPSQDGSVTVNGWKMGA